MKAISVRPVVWLCRDKDEESHFVTLSETANGKIIRCRCCETKVALMYNNIMQCYPLHEFYKMKETIDEVDIAGYFKNHPEEKKLHLRTPHKDLFFSFSAGELYEIRELFSMTHVKLTMYAYLNNFLN